MAETDSAARAKPGNFARNHSAPRIIDLSIDLDVKTFHMRFYDGFKKNMEFDVEVIKDYPGGLGQIVRGVHMRLHAGSHIDAPSHMLQGGLDMHEVPLAAFIGDAVVADVRHRGGMEAITVADLEKAVADVLQPGDRILLRTDMNETYDGSPEWIARSPYIDPPAIDWMGENGVSLVGFDFYHGNGSREANPTYSTSHHCADSGVLTMPYIHNLGSITRRRFTLIAPPLKVIDVEASPVRAVALED